MTFDLNRLKIKKYRRIGMLFDAVVVCFAVFFAYWITVLENASSWSIPPIVWIWLCFNVALTLIWYISFGIYSYSLRTIGLEEALKIFLLNVVIGCFNVVFVAFWARPTIGYSTVLLYSVGAFGGTLCWRLYRRFTVFFKRTYSQEAKKEKKNVMIVGGGDAGVTLIKEMLYSDKSNYKPVCIIDDDKTLQKKTIYNIEVVGGTNEMKTWVNRCLVEEIFIAMPAVSAKRRSEIVKLAQETKVPVKVLPGIYQLANGQVNVSKLRHVEIQDLLGREQVQVNLEEVMGYIQNKVVLVTGGGGSIGSELCRQIAEHAPRLLIILDIYENNAYDIEQELKRNRPETEVLTLIASVRDRKKIFDVFDKYRPQIVFNAAAHKHVPLMETSPNEAVKNNVFGTLNVAQAADSYGVETFVQISTDKAVNPTNIMGATKRICEMIVQTIGKYSKTTNFVAVRFGNVLGSNGSVIPLFKRQIKEGGPITLTHKDIIRYFMTIPEAVSLVLQAGAYAKGGQIFVLDMGEPVRIYDLAYNLIKLSGLEPEVDIEIKCTGLRPGEKLFEERLMEEEGLQKTANGMISVAKPLQLDEENFWKLLERLNEAAHAETEDMKKLVKELVPTYTIDQRESASIAIIKAMQEEVSSSQEKKA